MRIAVIGGGLGGMAAAALLAKDGHKVEVFEKNEQLGGRASVLREKGFTFDMGPSWYLMPDVFERFFAEFGLDAAKELGLVPLNPSHRFYYEGSAEPVDVPGNLEGAADVAERLEPGSRQRFLDYVERCRRQYGVIVGKLLYRKYESPLDLLTPQAFQALSAGLSLVGTVDTQVSRRFKSDRLRKMLEYSMVFIGTSPYEAPALYSMMSHVDYGLGVMYPMGGMGRLVTSLMRIGRRYGVDFHLNAPVQRIESEKGRATAVVVGGKRRAFDAVISNGDMYHTETALLAPKDRSHSDRYWKSRTLAPSGLLLFLGVKGAVPQLAHHTLYFAEDWKRHFNAIFRRPAWPDNPCYYVCAPSKTDPSVAPEGHENMFVFVPIAADLGQFTDIEALAEKVLDHLSATVGIPDLKERIVVKKAFGPADFAARYNAQSGTALGLAHTLTQTAIFRPHMRSRKLRNLFYVGAGVHPGVGMPTSIISAQVLRDLIAKSRHVAS